MTVEARSLVFFFEIPWWVAPLPLVAIATGTLVLWWRLRRRRPGHR